MKLLLRSRLYYLHIKYFPDEMWLLSVIIYFDVNFRKDNDFMDLHVLSPDDGNNFLNVFIFHSRRWRFGHELGIYWAQEIFQFFRMVAVRVYREAEPWFFMAVKSW